MRGMARLFALGVMVAVGLAAVGLAAGPAAAQQKHIKLTSLEWPPYTGASLPDQGGTAAVVRAAFAAVGVEAEIEFYPWNRAVAMARHDPAYLGYFPEYLSPEVKSEFALSAPIGTSPLGFAERVAAPVAWNSLDELKGTSVGVVEGYVNTDDLDARLADGRIKADKAKDDVSNLRKLAAGRVPLAVVDANVFDTLMAGEPSLAGARGKIRMNARLLENKGLFICFRNDTEGRAMRDLFNQGLARIDMRAIYAAHGQGH